MHLNALTKLPLFIRIYVHTRTNAAISMQIQHISCSSATFLKILLFFASFRLY